MTDISLLLQVLKADESAFFHAVNQMIERDRIGLEDLFNIAIAAGREGFTIDWTQVRGLDKLVN